MATVAISRRAVERLRGGAVWVYRSDLERVDGAEPGGLVTVTDSRGMALGSGIYSSASEIAVRMVSGVAGLGREAYLADVATRLRAAIALRERLAPVSATENAHRVVFSEADALPGVVVDRYNDLLVVQLLTQATAREDVRGVVTRVLREVLQPASIVERTDARIVAAEELQRPESEALFQDRDEVKLQTEFTINGLRFGYDAGAGQKTGAFLDQRLNYPAAARAVAALGMRGEALDVCTYQGGFALHLAEVCERVTGVDASRAALEVADRNLERNPQLGAKVDWIEADAFELLREFDATGRRFDAIVLDPPAFAKSKRALEGAMRGYKEMNLRALKMVRAGGTLVTCSCSQHVGREEFREVVSAAAADARRRVQVLEVRGAAPDHPAVLGLAETDYLKCLVCRVE